MFRRPMLLSKRKRKNNTPPIPLPFNPRARPMRIPLALPFLPLLLLSVSGCAPNFLVRPCRAPPPPDPALMLEPRVEEGIRNNLPSGTLLRLSKQDEMQTLRLGDSRTTSLRYAGLSKRE